VKEKETQIEKLIFGRCIALFLFMFLNPIFQKMLALNQSAFSNHYSYPFQGIDFLRIGRHEIVHDDIQERCVSGAAFFIFAHLVLYILCIMVVYDLHKFFSL